MMDENLKPTKPNSAEDHFDRPVLDRLVDGELGEADRRELLVELEHQPEGWRRCALAFLEAQCWKSELGLLRRSSDSTGTNPMPAAGNVRTVRPAQHVSSWRQHLATAMTLAACFLITLALGMGIRGNWSGGHGPGTVVRDAKDVFPLNNQSSASPAPSADKWEMVALSANSPNGQTETVNIPAVRRDTFDQKLAEQFPEAMPPEVRRAFEQSGYQIDQQREIVPVPMQDSQRLMVPVDHVQIHYVGRGSL